jgi:hypothetical protein
MSDALRAAADSAPVEQTHVSVGAVRSRARRNRAVRVGANGIVGVGAAALIFAGVAGVVANQAHFSDADAEGLKSPDTAAGAAEPGVAGDDSMVAGGGAVACGVPLDLTQFPAGDVSATYEDGGSDGKSVQFKISYSTKAAGSFTTDPPTTYVIWNGLVVAAGGVASDDNQVPVTSEAESVRGASFDLVNCWDGSALPAGDYTIVTVTPVSADIPPVPEPTTEPSKPGDDPVIEPGPDTTVDPNTSVSSDAAGGASDVAVAPVTYAVSDAVGLTIAGDPAKDPFQQYLNPTDPGTLNPDPGTPSDALTSDEARKAYEAALTGKWDMAVGTQRVVLTSDSKSTDQNLWATGYYGCPMDGTPATFPAQSADLNWLGVSGDLPSSVHVSYGWIVDGNPLVHYTVKNNSDWSLPGFYEGSSPRLVLVKDGRVVAEAYPVNPNQNNTGVAYATDDTTGGASAGGDKLIFAPQNGYLAPGDSLRGDYLWRDLNGCWSATGASSVGPGTYTVLSAQDLYLGNDYAIAYQSEGDAGGAAADVAPDAAVNSAQPEPIMAPAPADGDSVSFTVWTSLGTVTVTN